jgi:TRAP-type C4-dicarboxylate transport system permease small subunit
MRRTLDALYLGSGYAAGFFLVMTFAIVLAQVLLNLAQIVLHEVAGIAFKAMIPSYSEFATYAFAAASFLGLGYTYRSHGHVRVTLLSLRLPVRGQLWLELWCLGCGAAMAVYFTFFAIDQVVSSFRFEDVSSGLIAVPLWMPQSAMAAGLAILAIALIDDLLVALLKPVWPIRPALGQTALGQTGVGSAAWVGEPATPPAGAQS